MRISDLSSDVCSSDLARITRRAVGREGAIVEQHRGGQRAPALALQQTGRDRQIGARRIAADQHPVRVEVQRIGLGRDPVERGGAFLERDGEFAFGRQRSEEHTSELQSLMRISYAVFCLKKKKSQTTLTNNDIN